MARANSTSGADLSGKVIFITGAARRIGREIALLSASRGADVAFTYLNSQKDAEKLAAEIGRMDRQAFALRCDVTDEREVKEAVAEVEREMGGIDILVNNAANYETVPFEELTLAHAGRGVYHPDHRGRHARPARSAPNVDVRTVCAVRPTLRHLGRAASGASHPAASPATDPRSSAA